jgi:hypothetical protein
MSQRIAFSVETQLGFVADPSLSNDAATKHYVDTHPGSAVQTIGAGPGISITGQTVNPVINLNNATNSIIGGVKPDNYSISVDSNGTISSQIGYALIANPLTIDGIGVTLYQALTSGLGVQTVYVQGATTASLIAYFNSTQNQNNYYQFVGSTVTFQVTLAGTNTASNTCALFINPTNFGTPGVLIGTSLQALNLTPGVQNLALGTNVVGQVANDISGRSTLSIGLDLTNAPAIGTVTPNIGNFTSSIITSLSLGTLLARSGSVTTVLGSPNAQKVTATGAGFNQFYGKDAQLVTQGYVDQNNSLVAAVANTSLGAGYSAHVDNDWTTAFINGTAPLIIDGYTVQAGDAVLLINQAALMGFGALTTNGLYIARTVPLTGSYVLYRANVPTFNERYTANNGSLKYKTYINTTNIPLASIVEGTTVFNYAQFGTNIVNTINTGFALTGGPINSSGTISYVPRWDNYVQNWDSTPALSSINSGNGSANLNSFNYTGQVYEYTWSGPTGASVKRYRLVPTTYSPLGDSFWTTNTGGTLTGFIIARNN